MTLDLPNDITWSLDELVAQAQRRLPDVVPEEKEDQPFNPRLVRYYQSEGFVDRPQRLGREARYGRRQLLQLLTVRRLLADGWRGAAIAKVTARADDDLEALLRGGAEVTVEAANPALAFLASVRERDRGAAGQVLESRAVSRGPAETRSRSQGARLAAMGERAPERHPRPPALGPVADSRPSGSGPLGESWTRLRLQDDIELSVRSDFRRPRTPEERRTLRRALETAIDELLDHTEED